MQYEDYDFVWDLSKATSNAIKLGVSFNEASTVFADLLNLETEDPGHSGEEERRLVYDESERGRLLVVSFVIRDELIRIISARKMTPTERAEYTDG